MKLPKIAVMAALVLPLLSLPDPVDGSVIARFSESDGDVVVRATGTFDISTLNDFGNVPGNASTVDPSGAILGIRTDPLRRLYGSLNSPTNFGSGGERIPDLIVNNGDAFEVIGNGGFIVAETGVLAGTVDATLTFFNETFATLGLDVGVYDFLWEGDSARIMIGPTPIPLPATLPLALATLLGTALLHRGRARPV